MITEDKKLCKYCNRLKLHAETQLVNLVPMKNKKDSWLMEKVCRVHCDWINASDFKKKKIKFNKNSIPNGIKQREEIRKFNEYCAVAHESYYPSF